MKGWRVLLPALLAALSLCGAERSDGEGRTPLALRQASPTQARTHRRARRAPGPTMDKSSMDRHSAIEQKATKNTLSQSTKQKVDNIIDQFMSDNQILGIEISIQKNGKTIYECGCGTIEKGSKVLPGPNTRFQIDSLTKVFTAFAVLRLSGEGRVDIDQNMGKYISLPNKKWESIPIRQYLGMVTGIPDGGTTTGSYKQVIANAATAKLDFEPGSQYEYSNVNYFILGDLVTAMSPQKGFMDYTKEKVLAPFGMTNTGFLHFEKGDLWPTPYKKGMAVPPRPPSAGFSGGGFVSTMNDLEKFGIGLYNRWVLGTKSYKDMWTPTVRTSGPNKGQPVVFGLGWKVVLGPKGGLKAVSKDGGGWGWASELTFFPRSGDSVILLCTTDVDGIGKVALNIDKAVGGE